MNPFQLCFEQMNVCLAENSQPVRLNDLLLWTDKEQKIVIVAPGGYSNLCKAEEIAGYAMYATAKPHEYFWILSCAPEVINMIRWLK
jgi:hypothetical protein